MPIIDDLHAMHRAVVLASVDVVSTVTLDDLPRSTPCVGWNLADLLTHMTVQHHGFAAAAHGRGADPAAWEPGALAEAVRLDPVGSYAAAATEVLEAFTTPDVLGAVFTLPELGPGAAVPGSVALGFHFLDYVVHTWDVARTMGTRVQLPDDVLAAALPIAFAVPDGDYRAGANALFRPAIPAAEQADDLDRIVAQLGRDPHWAVATR